MAYQSSLKDSVLFIAINEAIQLGFPIICLQRPPTVKGLRNAKAYAVFVWVLQYTLQQYSNLIRLHRSALQ